MMTYEIVKRDNSGETTIMDGECSNCEDALEVFIDCVLDHGQDDPWLIEDYLRIRNGKNAIRYNRLLDRLEKAGEVDETFIPMKFNDDLHPDRGEGYDLVLRVDGQEEDDYEDELFMESWDPAYDDQPVNQWGEKWQLITETYLNALIENIIKDVQIDPYEDGPKLESLSLGGLHICEDGHLIATIYGGANGGGFRGQESNWPFYLALVRKFLGKLMDYSNRDYIKDVWLIDWDNDCCDDVWTLRLGIELSDKEKFHLVECGKKFSVVDPTKLNISLDALAEIVNPNDPIQVANVAATVA